MSEELPDGSVFLYGFVDDKLSSVNWASGSRVNMAERFRAVRNELIRVHGQPTVETGARVDSLGSIARIVRDVYRPTIETDYMICLMATSEGIEVALTNEAIARKHGINMALQTYEEVTKAISSVVSPSEKPSDLVDYLAAERKKDETSQPDASPKPPTPQPPPPSTPVPAAKPLSSPPVAKVVESPALVIERKAPLWPWLVGILTIIVIAALALSRSRPS